MPHGALQSERQLNAKIDDRILKADLGLTLIGLDYRLIMELAFEALTVTSADASWTRLAECRSSRLIVQLTEDTRMPVELMHVQTSCRGERQTKARKQSGG